VTLKSEVMADDNSALQHRNKLYFKVGYIQIEMKTITFNCKKYFTILKTYIKID